jgi:hypothetical protein
MEVKEVEEVEEEAKEVKSEPEPESGKCAASF